MNVDLLKLHQAAEEMRWERVQLHVCAIDVMVTLRYYIAPFDDVVTTQVFSFSHPELEKRILEWIRTQPCSVTKEPK